jgi:hypothetical protein
MITSSAENHVKLKMITSSWGNRVTGEMVTSSWGNHVTGEMITSFSGNHVTPFNRTKPENLRDSPQTVQATTALFHIEEKAKHPILHSYWSEQTWRWKQYFFRNVSTASHSRKHYSSLLSTQIIVLVLAYVCTVDLCSAGNWQLFRVQDLNCVVASLDGSCCRYEYATLICYIKISLVSLCNANKCWSLEIRYLST